MQVPKTSIRQSLQFCWIFKHISQEGWTNRYQLINHSVWYRLSVYASFNSPILLVWCMLHLPLAQFFLLTFLLVTWILWPSIFLWCSDCVVMKCYCRIIGSWNGHSGCKYQVTYLWRNVTLDHSYSSVPLIIFCSSSTVFAIRPQSQLRYTYPYYLVQRTRTQIPMKMMVS